MDNKIIKCWNYRNGCTVTINLDSALTLMGGRYAGSLWAHAWYCRACDEALVNEMMADMENQKIDESDFETFSD